MNSLQTTEILSAADRPEPVQEAPVVVEPETGQQLGRIALSSAEARALQAANMTQNVERPRSPYFVRQAGL